jgi:hypothetical protein
VPYSPSRRRSATLSELEPSTFNADLFGLHKPILSEEPANSIDMDIPDIHWRSFPGRETDDDLIPMELTSKNYIPEPFETLPTTSTGTRSLLLWDHDYNLNDSCDMPTPRSPSPETFYLDPTILAESGDEELQNVYELRQRTAKSEKWDRERCRELSALLRLKLDEAVRFMAKRVGIVVIISAALVLSLGRRSPKDQSIRSEVWHSSSRLCFFIDKVTLCAGIRPGRLILSLLLILHIVLPIRLRWVP